MLSFLIEKEFKQLARNKIIPRMLVALPLMAMLVFPWAANLEIKNVRVDVVDNDHSPLSQRLVAEIGGSAYFNISGTSDSYPDALRKVDSDEADMIFVVPQNFEKDLVNGQGTQVQIAANSVNGTKGTLGSSYMVSMISGSTALREYSEKVKVTSAGQDIPSFSVSPLYKFNPSLDYKVFMVPALMVMLLTIICGFFPALNIVGEKESGTIEQINVTPVGKFQFILAKLNHRHRDNGFESAARQSHLWNSPGRQHLDTYAFHRSIYSCGVRVGTRDLELRLDHPAGDVRGILLHYDLLPDGRNVHSGQQYAGLGASDNNRQSS